MKYYYTCWDTSHSVKCYDTDIEKVSCTQLKGIVYDNTYCVSLDNRELTFLDTLKTISIYFNKGKVYILHDTLFYKKNSKIILYSIKNYKLVEIKRIFEKFQHQHPRILHDCIQFWWTDMHYTKITRDGARLSYPYSIRYLNLDYDVVIYNNQEVRKYSTGEIMTKKAFLVYDTYLSTDDWGNVYFISHDRKLLIFSLPTFELLHEVKIQTPYCHIHKNIIFNLNERGEITSHEEFHFGNTPPK